MLKFRHDINALRALAVSAVILYHYKVNFISGGFVGVDIFFVISGYLMTQIIMKRLESGSFNLFQFYFDRANRIVPGLAGLCTGLIVFGYFFIDPITYNKLTYSAISALLFYSNYMFQSWTGYFDPAASAQWLLHTWSLSVEWQFYMLYPILLFMLFRYSARRIHLILVLSCLALVSFLYCMESSSQNLSSAFYFLPQRAWELLAGGIVALCFGSFPRNWSAGVFATGMGLILFSLVWIDDTRSWPNYRALLPVLGTCFVIAAHRPSGAVTSHPIVQGLGKWSYSLYLWHWPIAVAFLYFGVLRASPLRDLLVLALLFAPAIAVSEVMRRGSLSRSLAFKDARARALFVLGPFGLAMALALVVDTYRGLSNRRPDGAEQVKLYKEASTDWAYPSSCDNRDSSGHLRPCTLGAPERPGVLIIGDSLAMQLYNRLAATPTETLDRSFTFLIASGCPIVPAAKVIADSRHCNGFIDEALHHAETKPLERIVLFSAWHGHFAPTKNTLCFVEGDRCDLRNETDWYYRHLEEAFADFGARLLEFKRRGVEIVFVVATPYGTIDFPLELMKRRFWGTDTTPVESIDRDWFTKASAEVNRRLRALADSIGAKFFDPVDFVCGPKICPTVDAHGVSYFFDRAHYRGTAVRGEFFRFFDDVLGISRN